MAPQKTTVQAEPGWPPEAGQTQVGDPGSVQPRRWYSREGRGITPAP